MLSVIIITKNEAEHIARCLESVSWADEIVVLDSGSEDETLSICRQYTNKVYETDWPGFGIQKQRALDKATGDWVLSIDADEVVTDGLRAEIEQAIQQNNFQAYEIPRLSTYCGRQMRHSGWWPDYVLRLFVRSSGRFSEAIVHERVLVEGKIGRLVTPFLHDTAVDLEEILVKVNSYSTLGSKMLYEKGAQSSIIKAVLKGLWTFNRTYWLKAGFLDGAQGLMLAISNAEASYYKYLKLWALQHK